MPHFRIDDALHSHPKAIKAGDEALGFWSRAGSFCMAYGTDGFVPEWWVKQQPKGIAKAKRLISAALWHPGEHENEPGFWFHQFLEPGRQDSKAKIEADREAARQRKANSRASQRESQRDIPSESQRDSARTPSRTRARYPTQPNPEENSGYVPESASLSTARDAAAATPGADLVREIIPPEHPDAVRTVLRIRASELIRNGTPRSDVAAALELWLAKPSLGPNALPTLVSEAVKSRAAPAANGHDAKVNDYLAFANHPQQPEIEQ